LQHDGVTPVGYYFLTPASAHPHLRVVKELPIEDFYQEDKKVAGSR
jgi:hypothetical protein